MDFRQALSSISPDLMDILLPFVLVFTVIYAISFQVPQLKESDKFRIIIALVVSLLVIIPHVTGQFYYGNVDVVDVINQSVPQVALIIVAVVLVLLLIGATGKPDNLHFSWVRWVALLIVAGIFLDNINYGFSDSIPFLSWFSDSDFQALLLIVVIFGLIVWFITSSGSSGVSNEDFYRAALKTHGDPDAARAALSKAFNDRNAAMLDALSKK